MAEQQTARREPQTLIEALDDLAAALKELNEVNRKIITDLRECTTQVQGDAP